MGGRDAGRLRAAARQRAVAAVHDRQGGLRRDARAVPDERGPAAPGRDSRRGQAALDVLAAQLVRERPEFNGWDAFVAALHADMVRDVRPAVLVLFGAVGLVLLIGCGNLATLLLARALAREREIAIRRALGAGTGRLLSQLLTESLVLSLGGAALGLVLASWLTRALMALVPAETQALFHPALDLRAAAFAVLLAVVAALRPGSGLADGASDLVRALREGGAGSGLSGSRRRIARAVVAGRSRCRWCCWWARACSCAASSASRPWTPASGPIASSRCASTSRASATRTPARRASTTRRSRASPRCRASSPRRPSAGVRSASARPRASSCPTGRRPPRPGAGGGGAHRLAGPVPHARDPGARGPRLRRARRRGPAAGRHRERVGRPRALAGPERAGPPHRDAVGRAARRRDRGRGGGRAAGRARHARPRDPLLARGPGAQPRHDAARAVVRRAGRSGRAGPTGAGGPRSRAAGREGGTRSRT